MEQAVFLPGTPVEYTSSATTSTGSITSRFLQWCAGQEDNRFLWLGMTFFGQIGLVLPATLFSIIFLGGNHLGFWIAAAVINVPVLALTLAAQPTRVTLPCLFSAWILDIGLILTSVILYFNA
jgi:hypothetical protein